MPGNVVALTSYLEMMLVDSDVAEPRVGLRPITVVRAALVVVWLVWAALAWWSLPRPATLQQLEGDLAAGRIVSYTRADTWEYPQVWAWPTRIQFGSQGGLLIWITSDARTRYATPDFVHGPDEVPLSIGGTVLGEHNETTLLARRLDVAGIPQGATSPVGQATMVVAFLLLVVGLGVLIGGPDPARGTRWFWFWIGQLPLGLGYLAWLALERPWAAPGPGATRRSGWLGFGLLIAGGIVISILLYVARDLLGSFMVPI